MTKKHVPSKGARLFARYLERKNTLDQVIAMDIGIHPSYVGMLAREERTPGLAIAFAIQDVTHIPARSWLQP